MPWSGSVNFDILRRKTSVKLPIIFIKIKVGQMLPFSYISSLLVSFFTILHLISYFNECKSLFLGLNGFCINHIGKQIFNVFPKS